ncbi:5-formyltetrahydrofolate cyclo-ligase, mitochondrial-like [Miscanthus floridulus]|uniref:5-formyltetrahydrofolate cyclo-ligase, mitochondrial-like n=1 Tax=Miscanthus floridulus TaxID=154761 RepID=UPI00345883AD
MRMLKITTMDDLVKNSMNILEPSPVDATGNDREDVLSSSSPVDLLLLPEKGEVISTHYKLFYADIRDIPKLDSVIRMAEMDPRVCAYLP